MKHAQRSLRQRQQFVFARIYQHLAQELNPLPDHRHQTPRISQSSGQDNRVEATVTTTVIAASSLAI